MARPCSMRSCRPQHSAGWKGFVAHRDDVCLHGGVGLFRCSPRHRVPFIKVAPVAIRLVAAGPENDSTLFFHRRVSALSVRVLEWAWPVVHGGEFSLRRVASLKAIVTPFQHEGDKVVTKGLILLIFVNLVPAGTIGSVVFLGIAVVEATAVAPSLASHHGVHRFGFYADGGAESIRVGGWLACAVAGDI